VEILEVGPRDGLQNESVLFTTDQKLELIERSVAAGARRIEATSFVHPRLVPQMADAEGVMAGVPRGNGVSYSGLVVNRRGYDRAVAAGVDEVNCVVVASETFSRRNQGMSVDEALDVVSTVVAESASTPLKVSVTVATAFGCPFEGEVDPAAVQRIVRRVGDLGVDEVALADTIGVGVPTQVRDLALMTTTQAPDADLRFHFHNTRNTGYANAVAALDAGATVLDASLGGIGGCPFAPAATGNIATEDLAYLLARMGVPTGLDLATLVDGVRWLDDALGTPTPGQLARAGLFPA
jgi:hydroxymethylglutaryl-CoA lyase